MQIAAAAPNIPWTDLAYSLAPNGSTLDYVADAPYRGRLGVEKQSFVERPLPRRASARRASTRPPGTDPTADLIGWQHAARRRASPTAPTSQAIVDELTQHHSSYYIDHSIPPAPMLMSSGFTDDLFPADETIRYYNRTRTAVPGRRPGAVLRRLRPPARPEQGRRHRRAARRRRTPGSTTTSRARAPSRPQGVDGVHRDLPGSRARRAARTRRRTGRRWRPGEIRYDGRRTQTIAGAGCDRPAAPFNPVSGGGACATTAGADQPGAADLRARPGARRRLHDDGLGDGDRQVHAPRRHLPGRRAPARRRARRHRRRWSPRPLAPGDRRPDEAGVPAASRTAGTFAEGHVPKLELLPPTPTPAPLGGYGRASNDQQPVTVSDLELRIPVVEKPGSLDGPRRRAGAEVPARGLRARRRLRGARRTPRPKLAKRKLKVKGSKLVAKVSCPAEFAACNDGKVVVDRRRRRGGEEAVQGRQGQVQVDRRRQDEDAEAEADRQGAASTSPRSASCSSRSRCRSAPPRSPSRRRAGEGGRQGQAPARRALSRSRRRWRPRVATSVGQRARPRRRAARALRRAALARRCGVPARRGGRRQVAVSGSRLPRRRSPRSSSRAAEREQEPIASANRPARSA